MKWQKNTGVMPCDGDRLVKVRYKDGVEEVYPASPLNWGLGLGTIYEITHYCLGDVTFPPFDYVEPKVWTVEDDRRTRTHVFKRFGEPRLRIENLGWGYVSETLDALNAWEERNGH